jgi:hypothetical protein
MTIDPKAIDAAREAYANSFHLGDGITAALEGAEYERDDFDEHNTLFAAEHTSLPARGGFRALQETTMSNIRDYNDAESQAFQGDVCIFRVPDALAKKLNRTDETAPFDGRLILQAGEFSGHHHAIKLPQPAMFHDGAMAQELATKNVPVATVRMFRDAALANALIREGTLTRADLCVGFLEIEGGSVVVNHEEHDGIRLHPGCFYVGRQVESAGAEERIVKD